jgi:hypothetical protein
MTMPNTDPKPGSVFSSFAGQMTLFVIALTVILLIAWRYVF